MSRLICLWLEDMSLPVHDHAPNSDRLSPVNLSGTLAVKMDWPLRAEANWVVQYSDTILLADGEHRKVPAIYQM